MLPAFAEAVHRLGQAKLQFAALALALYVFSLWVGAVRWRRLLLAMGCRVRVMRLLLVNLVGICANNVTLNSRVAGEGARLAALRVTDGVSADRLVVSTLYERIADVAGGVLVILIAIPAAWTIGASLRVTRSAIGVAAIVGATGLVTFLARRRLARIPVAGWWRTAVARYAVGRSTFAFTTLCSLTISIQDPLRLMAGAAAFGVRLSLSQAAMVSAASMFAGGIPTIGALGGVEGGLIAALVALDVSVPTAVAITALERSISLVFSTAAGGAAVFWLGGRGLWRRLRTESVRLKPDTTNAKLVRLKPDTTSTKLVRMKPDTTNSKPDAAYEKPDTPELVRLPPPRFALWRVAPKRSEGGKPDATYGQPDARSDGRKVVLIVCGNGPDPITLRKIEALASTDVYDVHLVYWRDGVSMRTYPFSVAIPPSSVHPVDLPDPNGLPLRGLGLLIRFHARLFAIAARLQPDVVHAVNFDMLIGAWLLCLGRPRRTLVYDLLDTQESLRGWPAVLAQRVIMRRVDRIYATSPQFVSGFLRPLKLIRADDHPVVIPNAPWAATFVGIARRRDGPFVVGYIGSFRGEPAITWLCESVDDVRRSGMEVEILFAGTGEARPLVEAMARRHAFVHHEGAYDYATDIRALYERVDLVFAVYDASWDKRTHLACRLSDAIAAGRPIVAAAGTYMGDLVSAHRLGYVVDFADPASLAAAIRDGVERRQEWSDPSRIPAELRREHTFEHYVPDLQSTYEMATRHDVRLRVSVAADPRAFTSRSHEDTKNELS